MNKNAIVGVVVAVLLIIGGAVGYKVLQTRSEAAKWSGPIAEIEKSSFKRESGVAKSHFESMLAAPLGKVEAAVWNVEGSAGTVENIKLSKLVKHEGNTKIVEMQIKALNLPIQAYTMEFTFAPQEHRIRFRTTQAVAADLVGSYLLEGSPDGTRTRLIYDATATEKTGLPVPDSVIESASKETFTQMIRGIKKMVQ